MLIRASVVDRNFASPTFVHAGAWWTRCSAQVWNEASALLFNKSSLSFHTMQLSDFEYVGNAFKAICADIVEIVEKCGKFPEFADTRLVAGAAQPCT